MIFGVNAEITRRAYYGGLSAEMLNNRKLFTGSEEPAGWNCRSFARVTDQPERSLCGSNFVILHSGTMEQTSEVIALRAGKSYEAKLWVKAYSENAAVTFGVSGLEKTFAVAMDENACTELAFVFDGIDLDNGTFRVCAQGDVAVFELSLLPTDHFYGMRSDVVALLKKLAPTSLRFPGGCAADHFDWKESLKAREFRVPADGSIKSWFLFRDSYDQDPLDIGLNEFMMLCHEIGAQPEYTVSLLLSDGEDARRLVEYCNGSADTEYGARRQALGYDAFHIPLWFIGNEAYFFGDAYGMEYRASGAAAALRTNELTNAMRQADPSIHTVIGLTWADAYKQWNYDFMAHLDCKYEYASFHDYIGILPDASQGHNGMATAEMVENIFIDGESMGLNFYKYDLMPKIFPHIGICADEWNYSWGYDSSNAMLFSNALQFHFLAKSGEKYNIVRSEFFLPVNEGMITVRGAETRMESSGEMFRLMKSHTDGTIVECACETQDLDILCTAHDGNRCFVSVVNRRGIPCLVVPDGYRVLSAVEVRTGEYGFEYNDFTVEEVAQPVVSGHSVLYLSLEKI